jgi:hypothetical protein
MSDSRRPIPPNPPRWQPNPDPASINVPGLDTAAPVLDQIEQIEQLITIKLQVSSYDRRIGLMLIDWCFNPRTSTKTFPRFITFWLTSFYLLLRGMLSELSLCERPQRLVYVHNIHSRSSVVLISSHSSGHHFTNRLPKSIFQHTKTTLLSTNSIQVLIKQTQNNHRNQIPILLHLIRAVMSLA